MNSNQKIIIEQLDNKLLNYKDLINQSYPKSRVDQDNQRDTGYELQAISHEVLKISAKTIQH